MNGKYDLNFSGHFLRQLKKLLKKNSALKTKFQKTLILFAHDPFFSSWIHSDLRIIWEFNENMANVLDLLDLGGHSGSKKVYK